MSTNKYQAFEVVGIEAEYMIVDELFLNINSNVDEILKILNEEINQINIGHEIDMIEIGDITWSNELVSHVIELKYTKPFSIKKEMEIEFHKAIEFLNNLIRPKGLLLLSTSMHPWYDPMKEGIRLWPYGQKEIYESYNRIFECKGHGWSNIQSVHINLPYKNDEELKKLHNSVRILLPLVPLLSSSSPYVEGKETKYLDSRLFYYENNQKKVPLITGNVIPDSIQGILDYHKLLESIYLQINPYDPNKILQEPWLNSRGMIIKEEYGAIEIRLMDIQESSLMDFSIINYLYYLTEYLFLNYHSEYELISTEVLKDFYDRSLKEFNFSLNSEIQEVYKKAFNVKCDTSVDLLENLLGLIKIKIPIKYENNIRFILENGNLATRLKKCNLPLNEKYKKIHECLILNKYYEV